jgi:cellulose synthase/poly-beta-1,6-N-acetylglucosamine synthase-like glycosyltransferase
MTLRQEYNTFNKRAQDKYEELSKKDYDFSLLPLLEYNEEEREELKAILTEHTLSSLYSYDFQEYLEQIFYLDRDGEENMAYVLKVNKEGIYIIDDSTYDTFYIQLYNMNNINDKLSILEIMESAF